MSPISSLPIPPPAAPALANPANGALGAGAAGAQPFKNILLEALDQVNTMQSQANQAVEQLVTGGDVNPAEVLTTLQKADISFRMMLQIRNKLVQAYQEVNNIRI
jgi:flagellar hook-basal body complex protein FliE